MFFTLQQNHVAAANTLAITGLFNVIVAPKRIAVGQAADRSMATDR